MAGNRIMDLYQQRAKAVADSRALLALCVENKWPDSETKEKYDAAFARVSELTDMIKAEEQLQAAERDFTTPVEMERPVRGEKAAAVAFQNALAETGDARRAMASLPEPQRQSVERLQLAGFDAYLAGNVAVMQQPEYRAALNITDVTLGGYLQPPTVWVDRLIQALDNEVVIRRLATKFSLPSGESLGAVSLETDIDDFSWTTEVPSAVSEDTALRLGGRELKPNPFAKLIKASKTLLRKTGAEALVRQRLAYKAGVTEEKYFMTGNGVKQPLGIFTASSHGISTSYDVATGNTAATPTFNGLKNALYAMKAPYRKNWLFHRDIVKLISLLMDGESRYIWEPSVVMGQPDRILGVPVIESEYSPNTITTGYYVGALGDFSFYWIADGLGVQVQRLVELYAATRQDGFIFDVECDAMPVLGEAFIRVKLG